MALPFQTEQSSQTGNNLDIVRAKRATWPILPIPRGEKLKSTSSSISLVNYVHTQRLGNLKHNRPIAKRHATSALRLSLKKVLKRTISYTERGSTRFEYLSISKRRPVIGCSFILGVRMVG